MKKFLRSLIFFRLAIASVDQAILSAANFIVSIILIKNVTRVEFGYYSIALPLLLFLMSIQNAVINGPLSILLITKAGTAKQRYAGSLCCGQFLAIMPMAALGLAFAGLLWWWGFDATWVGIGAAVCLAAVGMLFREFLRAYFYADETPVSALKLDTLYIACFLGLIFLSRHYLGVRVGGIFVLMGLSSFLFSWVLSRNRGWRFRTPEVRDSYRENWEFGRWALLGVTVTHIQKYCFLYILASLLGSAAVADVSASRLLLMPVTLAQIGWSRIAIPYGSRLREQQQVGAFFRLQLLASLVFSLGLSAYVVLLVTFSGALQALLLTGKYQQVFDYLLIWGTIFVVGTVTQNAIYGLIVMKRFDTIAKVNFLTMLVTVGCAFPLIRVYGIRGGFVSMLIGETILAVTLWYFFGKTVLPGHGVDEDVPVRSAHGTPEPRTPLCLDETGCRSGSLLGLRRYLPAPRVAGETPRQSGATGPGR